MLIQWFFQLHGPVLPLFVSNLNPTLGFLFCKWKDVDQVTWKISWLQLGLAHSFISLVFFLLPYIAKKSVLAWIKGVCLQAEEPIFTNWWQLSVFTFLRPQLDTLVHFQRTELWLFLCYREITILHVLPRQSYSPCTFYLK